MARVMAMAMAAFVTLLAAAAAAQDTAIIVSGNASQQQRSIASAAISSTAATIPGNTVIDPAFTPKDIAALIKCLADGQPWVCMNSMLRSKGVQRLALVSIDSQTASDGSPAIVITEQVVTSGLFVPIGDKRYCDHCTDDVLAKLVGELTRDILREVATRGGRTVVSIKSVPRGARITFDEKLLGATDRSISTYPGTHSLALELDGYEAVSRSVEASDGRTAEINVTLRPLKAATAGGGASAHAVTPDTTHDRLGHLPRYVPWACVGAGGAAILTGGILILTDSQPSTDPTSEHSRYYYSTQGPGIATAIAGALSVGVGLYVFHRQRAAASAVAATPLPGGAAITWTTAF